jgi:hypothetical protein
VDVMFRGGTEGSKTDGLTAGRSLTRFPNRRRGGLLQARSQCHGTHGYTGGGIRVVVNHDGGDGIRVQAATDLSVTPQIVDGGFPNKTTDPADPGLHGLHWLMPRRTATREMERVGCFGRGWWVGTKRWRSSARTAMTRVKVRLKLWKGESSGVAAAPKVLAEELHHTVLRM